MRIWHERLIPKLCRQHLLATWREGLGAYKIITEEKKGYRNHPAVREWEDCHYCLLERLYQIREEMIRRGYHPKELPYVDNLLTIIDRHYHKPWQTFEEQVQVLQSKNCQCILR